MKRTLKISVVWFALAAGIFLLVRLINIPKLDVLTYRGVETKGKILELFPNNHQTVSYSFMVNGKEYINLGQPDYIKRPFNSLRVGEILVVFYDPQEPTVSMLGYPEPQRKNELMTALFGGIFLSLFITFNLVRKKVL